MDNKDLARRRFLKAGATGIGISAGMSAGLALSATSHASAKRTQHWDLETDIVVCGSGAAGSTAALYAAKAGDHVVVIEKSAAWGGTSGKSGFHVWIPNNPLLQAAGIDDKKRDCLEYMAQYSYPHLFNPEHPTLGIQQNTYELLAAFYDNAAPMIEQIMAWDVAQFRAAKLGVQQRPSPDYFEHSAYNTLPAGRGMEPYNEDGRFVVGSEVVDSFRQQLLAAGADIRMRHRAGDLIRNSQGAVEGLQVQGPNGKVLNVRARKGVIFGTGCFTHNKQYLEQHQPLPVFGGCGVPTNEGDFIAIAGKAGAQMGNLAGAWRGQAVLEETIDYQAIQSVVFWPYGDSMFCVNKYGKRFGNEKRNYNDRAKTLYHYDANACEYPNLIHFMIYDQRTADLKAGFHPIPPTPTAMDYVISGNTLEELANNIGERLQRFKSHTGGVALDAAFTQNLNHTFERFNQFAKAGEDEEFGRGSFDYDQAWHDIYPLRKDPRWPPKKYTDNTTMYPLQPKGPYYCIILCPGTLGTNGGPMVNKHAQVLDYNNQPIPGLYAAGNCMAHPAANAYWAAGATIGTAMTFGKIAAESAHRAVKTEEPS